MTKVTIDRELLERLEHVTRNLVPHLQCHADLVAALAAPRQPEGDARLDERMKDAGMLSVAELLAGAPLDAFMKHAGVNDLAAFAEWLEMRRGECIRMHARYDLGECDKGDDLYEWTIAHAAVFNEVHINFKAAHADAQRAIAELDRKVWEWSSAATAEAHRVDELKAERDTLLQQLAERDAEIERLRVKLMIIASAEPGRHNIEWAKAMAATGNNEAHAKWRATFDQCGRLAELLRRARLKMAYMLKHGEWHSPEELIERIDAALAEVNK